MKKNKYLLFLLLLIIPLNVKANLKGSVYINCKSPVKKGETFPCEVIVDPIQIKEFSLTLPDDTTHVKYIVVSPMAPFADNSSNRNIKLSSAAGSTGTVANLNFKLLTDTEKNVSLKFINISCELVDGGTQSFDAKTYNIKVDKPITTTTTTKKIITTTTTTQSQTSKEFSVIFNYNNGTNKTITKKCSTTGANCNISLTDLETPERLSFKFNGWGNAETCTEGNTTTYKATQDTTLYACWTANVSDETLYLESLSIEDQQLEFSKFNLNYDLIVLYEVENLVIKATPSNANIKVDLKESYPIEVGENIITLNLADEKKGTSNTYTINVTRLKEGEVIKEISSDATLSNISIKDHNLIFSPDKFEYTIQISSKISSLDINVKTNNEFAEYLIEGNNNLTDGSIIVITVKAEDGTINTYMINIESTKGVEDYLMYIIAGGLGLILIILLVIIKVSKNKGTKNRKQKISKAAPAITKQTKNSTVNIPPVKPISVQNKSSKAAVQQIPATPVMPKAAAQQMPVTPVMPKAVAQQMPATPSKSEKASDESQAFPQMNTDASSTQNKEKLETLDL